MWWIFYSWGHRDNNPKFMVHVTAKTRYWLEASPRSTGFDQNQCIGLFSNQKPWTGKNCSKLSKLVNMGNFLLQTLQHMNTIGTVTFRGVPVSWWPLDSLTSGLVSLIKTMVNWVWNYSFLCPFFFWFNKYLLLFI